MLDPFSRCLLCALSALCLVGVVTASPLRITRADEVQRYGTGSPDEPIPKAGLVAINIVRDPFTGEPRIIEHPQDAPVVNLPHSDGQALPGNLPTSTIPALPQEPQHQAVRVTAIVTGNHPYAMLDIFGDHQIKGIGDRVDGRPIVAIDFNGVTLQGGERLSVSMGDGTR